MKKSKILLLAILCVVLCVLTVGTATFSWFERPQGQTGGKLSYMIDAADNVVAGTSVSDITMATYSGNRTDSGVIEYDSTAISDLAATLSNSSGLGAARSKYYRTVITNTSTSAQTVSLYIPTVTYPNANTSTKFCLGVNGPTRTHKYYGPNSGVNEVRKTKTNYTAFYRIYFQPKNDSSKPTYSKWHYGLDYWVHYGNGNTNKVKKLKPFNSTQGFYFVDIEQDTTMLYFSNSSGNSATGNDRTQTMSDVKSDGASLEKSLLYYNEEYYDSQYQNCRFGHNTNLDGISFKKYYEEITVPAGAEFDVSLHRGDGDYRAKDGSIEYYDNRQSSILMAKNPDRGAHDSYGNNGNNTGLFIAGSVGESKIYTKITGKYGDDLQVETTVHVIAAESATTSTDVPIVTNLLIPAAVGDLPGSVEIEWYIRNDSSADGMKYTISGLNLTL